VDAPPSVQESYVTLSRYWPTLSFTDRL